MPMMPFMGVRISWLMLARNSLLARLAPSAASLADSSSAIRRLQLRRPFLDPPLQAALSVQIADLRDVIADFRGHTFHAAGQFPQFILRVHVDRGHQLAVGDAGCGVLSAFRSVG